MTQALLSANSLRPSIYRSHSSRTDQSSNCTRVLGVLISYVWLSLQLSRAYTHKITRGKIAGHVCSLMFVWDSQSVTKGFCRYWRGGGILYALVTSSLRNTFS